MERRKFLTTGAIGLAAVPLATPAIAQDVRQWKMVTAWPKNLPGPGVAAQMLADRITALSGGRIEVKLYAAGELVPGPGVFDAVSEGTAELLSRCSGLLGVEIERHPALRVATIRPARGRTGRLVDPWRRPSALR